MVENGLTESERALARRDILNLQAVMQTMPQIQEELHHHFANGVYAREMRIPEGTVVVGKTHRYACINFIMQGIAEVRSHEGSMRIEAPAVFTSGPGTKRAIYAVTNLIWVTAHPAETEDLDELESILIAEDEV